LNVRSMYRAGSLRAVAEEISKYKLDVAWVKDVRWDGGGTKLAGEFRFFYGNGNENQELGTGFSVHKEITSAVNTVETVSDRMSYTILGGRWCKIIVLNGHSMSDGVSDHFVYMQTFEFSNLWNVQTLLYLKGIDNFEIFKF
jgi:hypothetical protein